MGKKVHPYGLRLGIIKDWDAKWYAGKEDYTDLLHEDLRVREHIEKQYSHAGISKIEIRRYPNRIQIDIASGKPGIIIGSGGSEVKRLRREIGDMTKKTVTVNITEVKNTEIDAKLVAESVAYALVRRVSHRRAIKQAVGRAMRAGAKGAKIIVSGRLGGSDMSRTERAWEGTVPLHTLRADIDYGFAEANTTAGTIGVKVWIYKGEVLPPANDGKARAQGGK